MIVRVLDPARSDWYAEQGLHTICAVKHAIEMFEQVVLEAAAELMYVIIVGGGKVGLNLARELIRNGQEVTLVENDRRAYLRIEQELEHAIQYGDGTELWVLERAGIQRADLVVAVTGDDEDNILICQVAKEKYLCERIIARCNNPRNLQHFKLLGIQPAVSATDLILNLIEHEVPGHGLVHLLDLPDEQLEIIEVEVLEGAPAAGRKVSELDLPEGSLIISVLPRGKAGFVPKPDTMITRATKCSSSSTPVSSRRSRRSSRANGRRASSGAGNPGRDNTLTCRRSGRRTYLPMSYVEERPKLRPPSPTRRARSPTEWRKLARAATFVAILTSPATFFYLTVHGWPVLLGAAS